MKHNKIHHGNSANHALNPLSDGAVASDARGSGFAPPADAVARKAYFTYVNQGSKPGHEVQHWLDAEAELIAESQPKKVQ